MNFPNNLNKTKPMKIYIAQNKLKLVKNQFKTRIWTTKQEADKTHFLEDLRPLRLINTLDRKVLDCLLFPPFVHCLYTQKKFKKKKKHTIILNQTQMVIKTQDQQQTEKP